MHQAMSRITVAVIVLAALAAAPAFAASDPLLLVPSYQLAPTIDAEAPRFGSAMATATSAGGLLLVGAPLDDLVIGGNTLTNAGRVSVFRRTGSDWTSGPVIQPQEPNTQAGMRFGSSLATNGDWLLIGAPYEDVNGVEDAGAVYFYRYNSTTNFYGLVAREVSPFVQADSRFGTSIAMSADKVVIGQPLYDQGSPNMDTGVVVMYRLGTGGASWLLDGQLLSPTTVAYEGFGTTLFLQDMPGTTPDRLFVGAPTAVVNFQSSAGQVHHYRWISSDWSLRETISWGPVELLDFFGSALAASGDYLFIGARGRSRPNGAAKCGSVQVQKLDAQGYFQPIHDLYAEQEQAGARFGASLALSDSYPPRLIIGAPQHDITTLAGTLEAAGRVYVLDPVLAGNYDWLETNTLRLRDGYGAGDELGTTVLISALASAEALAGAPGRLGGTTADAGRVQVFVGDIIFRGNFQP